MVDWRKKPIAAYFEPVRWHAVVVAPFVVPLQPLQMPQWLPYEDSSADESMQHPSATIGACLPTCVGDVLAELDLEHEPPDATNEPGLALHDAAAQLEVGPKKVVLSTR